MQFVINKDLHFPNVNFKNLKRLITLIYKHKINHPYETLTLKDIIRETGYSTTAISGSKTLAAELGLMRDNRDIYTLTNEGNEFAKNVLFENKNAIKSLGQKQIIDLRKSPVLYYMYQILKDYPFLSGKEIGMKVRMKFNKVGYWSNETCKNIGNSGISILSGFQLFEPPKIEKPTIKNRQIRISSKLHPRLSIESIQNYIKIFKDNEPVSFYSVLKGKVSNTIQNDLKLLEKLGLITKHDDNCHKLTKEGLVYRHSLRENNHQETFQVILSNLKHMKFIISKLNEYENDNIDYKLLGKILSEYNKKPYSQNSIKQYGTNLIGWLKYADIIQTQNGKNILNNKFKEENNKKQEIKIEKIKKIDEYTDFHSLFNALKNNYCDLFYSALFINSNQWALTNLKKDEIITIYKKLEDISKDKSKIIFNDAKVWFEEAFETSNKKYLKHSYDLFIKMK